MGRAWLQGQRDNIKKLNRKSITNTICRRWKKDSNEIRPRRGFVVSEYECVRILAGAALQKVSACRDGLGLTVEAGINGIVRRIKDYGPGREVRRSIDRKL